MSMPTPAITITRRLEFDAGHRIPHHDGQCRHLHGHRYAIELTVSGDVLETPGAAAGLKLAKGIVDKRKEKVAAGTAKPIFGAGGIFKGKPGGLIDKIKGAAAAAPEMQTKGVKLPEDPIGGSVQLPGGQFNVGFQPAEQPAAAQGTFFQKYKMPLLIGGGLLAVGGIYLATRKKSRRR